MPLRERLAALLRSPGGALLLLRAFLGVTFTFAGLQKLANPGFFRASAPGSFDQQLLGAMITSPLHRLLVVPGHAPVLFAVVIALGEVAVGLGTLAGLLARVAALGGMLLSLSFFLTISWTASPYYYGPDIVFLFAWTPLALGGAGAFSLDALVAASPRSRRPRPLPATPFPGGAGAREDGVGTARDVPGGGLARRAVLRRGAALGGLAAVGAVLAGLDALVGRVLAPGSPTPSEPGSLRVAGGADPSAGRATAPGSAPGRAPVRAPGAATGGEGASGVPKGTRLLSAEKVPVGGAAGFTDPAQGIPAYVVQPVEGTFRAFSAICTHAGCTVQFDRQAEEFVCPCHGSVFEAATGAVVRGPAPRPLPAIPVALGPGDELYVDG